MYEQAAWNIGGIMDGNTPETISADLKGKAAEFASIRDSLDPNMSAAEFAGILSAKEKIAEQMARAGGYASLTYAEDTQSEEAAALRTKMDQLGSEISNQMVFFDLWWKGTIDEANAARLAASAGDLSEYLAHKRRMARHALSEAEEKVVSLLDVTGASALVKLYDTITNSYTYEMTVDGSSKTLGREELMVYVRSAAAEQREASYRALLSRYAGSRNVLGEIYHNVVLNYHNEHVRLRRYGSPISVMNSGSNIDDSTVESLLDVCRERAPVFQRYFLKKAAILGMKRMRRYDLYAPPGSLERRYEYGDAVRMVLDTLGGFSDKLGEWAGKVFAEGHVHSTIQAGKMSGAFCSTITPGITPYILINYTGESRDVFTLAHETGHAVHSMAAGGKSILVQHAPLPLAETASTFSEMLLYDSMSRKMDPAEEATVLAGKIDDLYATISRQAFFTIFETRAHERLADGATPSEISEVYAGTLTEQFGDAVEVSEDFAVEWLAIPHFYHWPFYCYSYSFGNLLAASLFQRYKREGGSFAESYVGILAAGGSQKPETLLGEYGLDIGSANFWREGFDYVESLVDRLSGLL